MVFLWTGVKCAHCRPASSLAQRSSTRAAEWQFKPFSQGHKSPFFCLHLPCAGPHCRTFASRQWGAHVRTGGPVTPASAQMQLHTATALLPATRRELSSKVFRGKGNKTYTTELWVIITIAVRGIWKAKHFETWVSISTAFLQMQKPRQRRKGGDDQTNLGIQPSMKPGSQITMRWLALLLPQAQ